MSLQTEIKQREKKRKADLDSIVTESDFLDLSPLWAKDASIYIIIGSRCGGKTYREMKDKLQGRIKDE